MANLSKATNDHEEIQRWAAQRGGKPSHVKSTGSAEDIGILRIDFPGYSGEGSLEEISWDQFFEKFDERNLSLIYQERTADGEQSNFNKLVSASTAQPNEDGDSGVRSEKSSTKSAAKKKSSKPSGPIKKSTHSAKKGMPIKDASKTASRSVSANKSSAKSAATKKVTAKKIPLNNATPKKTVAKKTVAKKVVAKKISSKKGASKKRR